MTAKLPSYGDEVKSAAIALLVKITRVEECRMGSRQFASKLGVSHQTVLNWESGAHAPNITKVERLSTIGWVGELRRGLLHILKG